MSKHKKSVERPLPLSLGLPCVGIDSHAHLDPRIAGEYLTASISDTFEKAHKAGVSAVCQVFLHPDNYYESREAFCEASRNTGMDVFFLLGIHPCDGKNFTSDVSDAMSRAFSSDPLLRAVGEIGLDFYWDDCPRVIQEDVFRIQLAMAADLGRPAVIHSRNAASDTVRILEDEGWIGKPLLWHCFSGDAVEYTDRIVENGWSVAVGGVVTYPASDPLRKALRCIPSDRLLLETDCPYLSPVPWRGMPNEPAYSVFTCVRVAEILGMDAADLWGLCGDNARRFFVEK